MIFNPRQLLETLNKLAKADIPWLSSPSLCRLRLFPDVVEGIYDYQADNLIQGCQFFIDLEDPDLTVHYKGFPKNCIWTTAR